MKAVLHPLVHVDIAEAMEFYERVGGAKLAADFFYEYERVLQRIWDVRCPFPLGKAFYGERYSAGFRFRSFTALNQHTYSFSSSAMSGAIRTLA